MSDDEDILKRDFMPSREWLEANSMEPPKEWLADKTFSRFSDPIREMVANAKKMVEEKRKQGWKREDFARALKEMLESPTGEMKDFPPDTEVEKLVDYLPQEEREEFINNLKDSDEEWLS